MFDIPSSERHVIRCGRMDGRTATTKLTFTILKYAKRIIEFSLSYI